MRESSRQSVVERVEADALRALVPSLVFLGFECSILLDRAGQQLTEPQKLIYAASVASVSMGVLFALLVIGRGLGKRNRLPAIQSCLRQLALCKLFLALSVAAAFFVAVDRLTHSYGWSAVTALVALLAFLITWL